MITIRDILIAVVSIAWAIAAPFIILIILDKGDKDE